MPVLVDRCTHKLPYVENSLPISDGRRLRGWLLFSQELLSQRLQRSLYIRLHFVR